MTGRARECGREARRFDRVVIGVLSIVALAFLIAPASGVAATDLVPHGCIADTGDAAGCGTTADGLDGPEALAISPDGRSLYAATGTGAVTRFDRDASTGVLTPRGCIADVGAAIGCGRTQEGLGGARGIAVSPDGESVYAVSFEGAIVQFDRATDTGALTPRGCIADAIHPIAGCEDAHKGIRPATDVAVSPDGESVYVTADFYRFDSFPTGNALIEFDRDQATGNLSGRGCVAEASDPWGCGTTQAGLHRPSGIALSPDGSSLYVAALGNEGAIVEFDRGVGGGISGLGCIKDAPRLQGCDAVQEGLWGARSVAVSPEGRSVYVASSYDNALVSFDRNQSTGILTGRGCIAGSAVRCPPVGQYGLERATSVAVSPDGARVYVSAGLDAAISQFDRSSSTRALTARGCVADPDPGAEPRCSATQQGLRGAADLAVSPDGRSIYVAGNADDAIAAFGVEPGTRITSGRAGPTNDPTPRFDFRSDQAGSSFECEIDDAGFTPCSSPEVVAPLQDGRHTFAVRAMNPAGDTDQSPARRRFNVDTVAPTASISCPPAPAPTTSSPVRCTGAWDDPGSEPSNVPRGGIVYGLDTDPSAGTNYDGHFYRGPFDVSGEGRWDVLLIAVDRAGNASAPDTVEVTIGAAAPTSG